MPEFCNQCGHKLEPNARFCSSCGNPVGEKDDASQDAWITPDSTPQSASEREAERRRDFEQAWGGSESFRSSEPETSSTTGNVIPDTIEQNDTTVERDEHGLPILTSRKNSWEVERERVRDEADDEWSMSDLGPPPPQKRRVWLWVVIAILAAIVIACCVFSYWLTTDGGREFADRIFAEATQAAEATQEAATPVP